MNHKVRNSNIELLRIIAMYMIVQYHIVVHCVNVQLTSPTSVGWQPSEFFNQAVFYPRLLILNFLMPFGTVGNAVFMLIAGYFLGNRGGSDVAIGKISVKLLLQLGFASVLLVCIPPVVHLVRPDIYLAMQSITIFNGMSWFVGYYYVVVLCGALFLNNLLRKFDRRKYLIFLAALFAFIQFGWSGALADNLAGGLRTAFTGLFLYSMGGFIRRFNPFEKVRIFIFFLLIAIICILIGVSGYNVAVTRIESYIRSGSADPFVQSVSGYDNFSVVTVLLALCFFELFRRVHLPSSRILTFLGKSTFMIYLIHDNGLFYELWNRRDWAASLGRSCWYFLGHLMKWAAYVFLAGVAAYVLYTTVLRLLKKGRKLAVRRQETNRKKGELRGSEEIAESVVIVIIRKLRIWSFDFERVLILNICSFFIGCLVRLPAFSSVTPVRTKTQ